MSANFAFYIHHHGSGHVMRALAIASHLPKGSVSFLGSDLARYQQLIPGHIPCYDLPGDLAGAGDEFAGLMNLDFVHYAPLNLKAAAERTAKITSILNALFPVILIVDVSVEVTLLAALSSIPTVVIRQNGDRTDLPHLYAYQSAQMLIAPCSRALMNPSDNDWVEQKTFYSGGFSRYTGFSKNIEGAMRGSVGVMTGSGGTSINARFIKHLAKKCLANTIHVIGNLSKSENVDMPENVVLHGQVENPYQLVSSCELIIGNAGHNTVMEMADLNKNFICIPEARPFDEQLHKARLLGENEMAVVVDAGEIMEANWEVLIDQAIGLPANRWLGVINPNALHGISEALCAQWQKLFTA